MSKAPLQGAWGKGSAVVNIAQANGLPSPASPPASTATQQQQPGAASSRPDSAGTRTHNYATNQRHGASSQAIPTVGSPVAPSSSPPAAASSAPAAPPIDAYVVLDFEATCEDNVRLQYQEIIEFPFVVVDAKTMTIVSEFQRYVRPVHCPKLTDFCNDLTGIDQATVDRAQPFPVVMREVLEYLNAAKLGSAPGKDKSFLFVTCGDWDLKTMLPHQLQHTKIDCKPTVSFSRWVNLKRHFQDVYPRQRVNGMPDLLKFFSLPLQGRHHSGIDDCRNIAAVLIAMLQRGQYPLSPTMTLGGGEPFALWNGVPSTWPPSSLVAPEHCPPVSTFNPAIVEDAAPANAKTKRNQPPARDPNQILPNPKDFPIEYILATEPPPKLNTPQEFVAMSKKMSWALRHGAVTMGLSIDSKGLVPMDELLAHKDFKNKANAAAFAVITRDNEKKRYRIISDDAGRFFIGATQGHSILGIDADLKPIRSAADIPLAVHGTTRKAWDLIRTSGLSRMNREHIHFAVGLPSGDGVISGMRSSSAVLIYIDVAKCLADGVPLFLSQNGVVLCPGIGTTGMLPPAYFEKVVDTKA